MARTTAFTKRTLISKANSTIVITTTVAAFLVVFSLVAGRALISQASYQGRVIDAKKEALSRLNTDLAARDKLQDSYVGFVKKDPNLMAGKSDGTGPQDGDNAQIILDSLPSRYDFPALTTSLEKIITDQGLKIMSISGTDEEVTQGPKSTSPNPAPVAMPFQIQVNGSYDSIQALVDVFLRSVRPFQIQTMELTGDPTSMIGRFQAQTFYQPEKNLNITTKEVK